MSALALFDQVKFDPIIWGGISDRERLRVLQELSEPIALADPLPRAENAYKAPPARSGDDLDCLLSED